MEAARKKRSSCSTRRSRIQTVGGGREEHIEKASQRLVGVEVFLLNIFDLLRLTIQPEV